jgi:hypothetical protein
MGKRANIKQMPPAANAVTGVMAITDAEIAVTDVHITNDKVDVGVPRVPGCHIFKVLIFLNGYKEAGVVAEVRADSNAATSVVRLSQFADDCIVGGNDKIELMLIWKSGNNPLGIAPTPVLDSYQPGTAQDSSFQSS